MKVKNLRIKLRSADIIVISLLSLIMMNSLVEIVEDQGVLTKAVTNQTLVLRPQQPMVAPLNQPWPISNRAQKATRSIGSLTAEPIGKNYLPSNREKVALFEIPCTSEKPLKLRSPSSLAQIKLQDCGKPAKQGILTNHSTHLEATTFQTEATLTSEIISLSKGNNEFTYEMKDGVHTKAISFSIQH